MRFFFILIIGVFCTILAKAQTYNPDDIIGDWISPKKDLIVRCFKINNLYYGKVIWFYKYYDTEPIDPNGKPENQWLNTMVMSNFSFSNREWVGGEIYQLKTGKTYNAYIQFTYANTLSVTGYVFWRIFSETTVFNRYQESKLPVFN
jgi:uncharacterized protein (DUF2147 family)